MICIAWGGMPAYAECAVKRFMLDSAEPVSLIATPSDVPKTCSKDIAGESIHWVEDDEEVSIRSILGEIPRVLLVSGWFIPSFNRIAKEVRSAGGKVVLLMDHRWKMSLRIIAWSAVFAAFRRHMFDYFMVPGESGARLLRYCGVKRDKLATGMYTADPSRFVDGGRLTSRDKRIVFVGRFDDRKNILPFAEEFCKFAKNHKEWQLDCYGCGILKDKLAGLNRSYGISNIHIHEFTQPSELAKVYAGARIMVLPSLEDHWGVVVHEAALCGCALLLSSEVGAADDLCSEKNGFVFSPYSRGEMRESLERIASWTDAHWDSAHDESLNKASAFSPAVFSRNLSRLIGLKNG